MPSRDDIVTAARRWVGVPFRHQGRTRAGVDCLGMVIGVAEEIGARVPARVREARGYERQPNAGELRAGLDALMVPRARSGAGPGSVLLMAYGRTPQHLGVVTARRGEELVVVHVTEKMGRGVEHRLGRDLRVVKVYDFPEVAPWP